MIHKFKAKDLNIVLDVNSGGVHLVDDMTYDLLDYIEEPLEETCPQKALDELSGKYTVEQLKECYGEKINMPFQTLKNLLMKLHSSKKMAVCSQKIFTGSI